MEDIRLKIFTQGGDCHEIEAPPDIRVSDLLGELLVALGLSSLDADGHPIRWRLDNKSTGVTLHFDLSLEQQGVQDGNFLSLIRSVTAGCFAESSQVLLPDGQASQLEIFAPEIQSSHIMPTKPSIAPKES